jgi:glutamine synthetase
MRCVKIVPYKEYIKEDFELQLCSAAFFSPICYNWSVDGCGALDEQIIMRPDRSTFKVLPYYPTHGSVMCNIFDDEGHPWKFCPRQMVI